MPLHPGVRRVSLKEFRELSKLPWTRPELHPRFHRNDARLLPDGRVFWILGGTIAVLYPSNEAFQEQQRLDAAELEAGPVDLTRTLLPPVADFIRDVEEHAKRLSEAIRVPNDTLDRTLESLSTVEKGVWRLPQAKRMTPEVITPLTAYIGLVMLPLCDGRWTSEYTRQEQIMHVEEDGRTRLEMVKKTVTDGNEPFIKARDGRLLQPFAAAVLEIERGRGGSIYSAAHVALLPYNREGKPGPTS